MAYFLEKDAMPLSDFILIKYFNLNTNYTKNRKKRGRLALQYPPLTQMIFFLMKWHWEL